MEKQYEYPDENIAQVVQYEFDSNERVWYVKHKESFNWETGRDVKVVDEQLRIKMEIDIEVELEELNGYEGRYDDESQFLNTGDDNYKIDPWY